MGNNDNASTVNPAIVLAAEFRRGNDRWESSKAYIWGQVQERVQEGDVRLDKIVSDLRSEGMAEKELWSCLYACQRLERGALMDSLREHRSKLRQAAEIGEELLRPQ